MRSTAVLGDLGARPGLACCDQRVLAAVPLLQQLVRRRDGEDARVADGGDAYAGDLSGRRVDAVQVPHRLEAVREPVRQRPSHPGEHVGVADAAQRLDVQQLDDEQVAGFRAAYSDRTGERVGAGEIEIGFTVVVLIRS